jgi:hypothetical protein
MTCAALILALIVGAGVPAGADIVEVTTSVTMPAPATEEALQGAVNSAAQKVLSELGLQPAMMVITAAFVSAGRLYVRFLVADEAGARLLGAWGGNPETQEPGRTHDPHALRI